jgi:RimJ/RimL family protein N-acetyltransferase
MFQFDSDLILEDARVRLEPLQIGHLDALCPIAEGYPDLLRYSPSPFGSREKLLDYFEDAWASRKLQTRYPFAVFDKEKSAYAGSTSFANVSLFHQRLDVGYTWYAPPFQRSGLNRHCKFLLLRHAFEFLEMERVEFKIDSRNQASRTAVEKIGGQLEGTLRSHTLMADGYRRNTMVYSILKSEWPDIRSRVFGSMLDLV